MKGSKKNKEKNGSKGKIGSKVKSNLKEKDAPKEKSYKFDINDDFIGTISESEDDIPSLDSDDDDEEEEKEEKEDDIENVNNKNQKNSKIEKLIKRNDKFTQKDINPSFKFESDDFDDDDVSKFNGWDFEVDSESVNKSKDVDLDKIIQEKMGSNAESDINSDDESEKNLNSDSDSNSESEADLDDDSEKNSDNNANSDSNSDSDSDSDSDDSEVIHPMDLENNENIFDQINQDTAEERANFFAPESENVQKSIHENFQSLKLSRPLLKGISEIGYTKPTLVQGSVIPIALAGKDIVGGAITGSGKTAAYMIPILERLLYRPKKVISTRVVVLTPTRELAIQVSDVGKKLARFIPGLRFGLAVGGLNLRMQEQELKTRPDIVIATPGRFIDHVRNSPSFQVDTVEILVIDEADRMLEEGFQKELQEILRLIPTKRQTLLFSATMNSSIKSLIQLSLHSPVRIMINPPKQAAEKLIQEFVRIRKRESLRPALLIWVLSKLDKSKRTMVFVSRKELAHRLRVILGLNGIKSGELHGSLSQEQRLNSITNFKNCTVPFLICTDLASRGLDIPKVECVINYDLPKSYDIYLHRVGRTARAGRTGRSISFVGESSLERSIVRDAIASVKKSDDGRTLNREVNWVQVESIQKKIEGKEDVIKEILLEEKALKSIATAEMELKKGENLIKYEQEIKSRPKRTWFDSDSKKKTTNKKRKN